jgi:uncharacterized membrane protein
MSERAQDLIFVASLVGLLLMIYWGKMAYDRPNGMCLIAWRLAYLGAGVFFCAIGGLIWFGHTEAEKVWLMLVAIGAALTFSGIVMWLINPCGKTKESK